MKKTLVTCVFGLSLTAGPLFAGNDDVDFVNRASIGHRFAIEESQIALDRAADPRVKALAQQLIQDHEMAEADLQTASEGSGATAATVLDREHQMHLTALQGKTGDDFDRAFLADQVEIHSNTLTLYADYMLLGEEAKLKAYATKMIPVTETQYKKASAL
jgi:putative membrane protein